MPNQHKAKRRLFNMLTKEVSFVDLGANDKEFIIIKRGGQDMAEEKTLEELKGTMAKIGTAIDEIAKAIKPKEGDEEDVNKAGAKFAKDVLASLQGMYEKLGKILEGAVKAEKTESTEKKLTKEEATAEIMKGIKEGAGFKEEQDMPEVNKELVENIVKNVVAGLTVKE